MSVVPINPLYSLFTSLARAIPYLLTVAQFSWICICFSKYSPYSNGYAKCPGYMYNTSNTDVQKSPNNRNQTPGLSNFLKALQYGTNSSYTYVNPKAPTVLELNLECIIYLG